MLKFILAVLLLCVVHTPPAIGQDFGVHKYNKEGDSIPFGSVCYDVDGQMRLDEALESNTGCLKNLTLCREWRDAFRKKSKANCSDIMNDPQFAVKTSFLKKNQRGLVIGGLGGFVLGLIIMGLAN